MKTLVPSAHASLCLTFRHSLIVHHLYEKPLVCGFVLEQSHSPQCDLHGGSLEQNRVGVELPQFTFNAWLLGLEYELQPLGVTWKDHTLNGRGSEMESRMSG